MKLEFISNTGMFLEHNSVVLGMNPWITQGAYEGSWFHFPPLRPTKNRIQDCKYIYISQFQPDHCDLHFLKGANSSTVFLVPANFSRVLERKLRAMGVKNIRALKSLETTELEPGLKVTPFRQFSENLFYETAFGDLVNNAIVIEWDGRKILNCSDNYLTPEWAGRLRAEFKQFDLALMPHSTSGAYPASFRNLSMTDKLTEAERIQKQYVEYFVEVTEVLRPKIVVPCSAAYVVVGDLWEKNNQIGLASPSLAVERIKAHEMSRGGVVSVHHLDCGSILDLDSNTVSGPTPRNPSMEERMAYAKSLQQVPFPYQWEDKFTDVSLQELARSARTNLWAKQMAVGWKANYNLYITLGNEAFLHFNFSEAYMNLLLPHDVERKTPYLECFMDKGLFYQILTKRALWHDAELGLHIDYFRAPNQFVPEVYTLLSFFHSATAQ